MGKNSEEISRTLKLTELLVFDYEKKYISEIDVIIETTKNYNQLSTRIDSISKVILDDDFSTSCILISAS